MKRNISILLLSLALLGGMSAYANEGDSLWSHTYGGTLSDRANCIILASDGGFLLGGESSSFGAGGSDMWLVKTDAQGDSLWSQTYGVGGFYNHDPANAGILTADGGFALAGMIDGGYPGTGDMWLVKTDAQGDSLWSRRFAGQQGDAANSIIKTADGGFALAGISGGSGSPEGGDMWLVKTDAQGDRLWSRTYGGSWCDVANSVIQTTDGGYILGGWTPSLGAGSDDMWLVKTNAQGDCTWSKTYGGGNHDYAYCVIQATDGGYLLAGSTSSFGAGSTDMWLVKTNALGDCTWSQTYGRASVDRANCVIQTSDGGYALAGVYGNNDTWLVKTNAQGDCTWSRTYGASSGYDEANSIIQTTDGNYLLAGYTSSFGAGSYDMWLVCVDGTPDVTVSLLPINPPIIIPSSGGSFDYSVNLANGTTLPQSFDFWIMMQLPNQTWHRPMLGPIALTLPASGSLSRQRTQFVPGRAPAGAYWYEGRVGYYPSAILDTSGFAFTKLGAGSWDELSGWFNLGESFDLAESGRGNAPALQSEVFAMSVSPNPFNASTVLSYQLPIAGQVRLDIYDPMGRLVETLVDGWRQAGMHELTFDASHLPSGMYVYRIQAGGWTESGKMILLK